MTSIEEEFKCILCKESFNNKDDLQIHFRRHGDPKFNESIKAKGRLQNETPAANEKSNDASEFVNCDVCEEAFPTISKAITHKHKVHPEHDAKYFCPWCGKLFTLKHLYNKHLQTNHDAIEESPESNDNRFHCDNCNINFLVPSAMIYHNKFFHRQDTDLPIIGHSKKQKLCGQDLLPIYYCSFCGEEYINKVNLHKHICDDHSEENQRPLDVLRCPLCEAIFYHLDAYELHLTFHSSGDLYSETNEMNETDLTEFSLETVPPVMERIEDVNNLQNDETDVNAIGIESFLQMAMDEPNDGDQISKKVKSKKHKKHKKSKKSAITLDEFLNMNQDVFGEDLDFQGVEEVPTKVITRQLKPKKSQPQKTGVKFVSSADLQKLQKQGIVVKMKSGKRPLQVRPVGQPVKVSQHLKNIISHTKTNSISASNEVLSKLMNQSSNQLKIVKKSAQDKTSNDEQANSCKEPISEDSEDGQLNADPEIPENIGTDCNESNKIDDQKIDLIPKRDLQVLEDNRKDDDNVCESKKNDQCITAISNKTEDKQYVDVSLSDKNNDSSKMVTQQSPSVDNVSPSSNVNDTLKNLRKHITIKPVSHPVSTNIAQVEDCKSVSPKVDNETRTSGELNIGQIDESSRNKALDTLKNMNSAITIKSLKSRDVSIDSGTSTKINEKTDQNLKQTHMNTSNNLPIQPSQVEEFDEAVLNQHENCVENQDLMSGPSKILKNLSKNITIKSMSPIVRQPKDITSKEKNVSDLDKHEDEKLMEQNKTVSKVITTSTCIIRDSNPKQNLSVHVSKSTSHSPLANVANADENIKNSDGEQFDDYEGYKSNIQSNSDILKHLKNITAKPVPGTNARIVTDKNKGEANDQQFNDDEDSIKSNSQSNNDILKHLKNITAKPVHGTNIRIAADKNKINFDGEHFGDGKDSMKPNIQSNNDITKHLKNITTKPLYGAKINQQQTIARSTNTMNIIKGFHKQSVHKKELSDEIEIYNIDDSDSDGTETKQLKIENIKATPIKIEPTISQAQSNITLNAIKNMNKHVSVKSSSSQSMRETGTENKNQLELEPFSDEDEIHNETMNNSDDDFDNNVTTNPIKAYHAPNTTRQKADSFNSVIKNLSKHITVKSSNVSPSQSLESFNQTSSPSLKSFNQTSQDFNINDDDVSDAEFGCGKVKITEITEDNDSDHTDICENKGIVTQSPDDSNSGNEHSAIDMEDSDEHQNQVVKKAIIMSNPNFKSTSDCLLKNISKHVTIKSFGEKSVENRGRAINTLSDKEKIVSQNKLGKELLINPSKQSKPEIQNDAVKPRNQNIVYNKRPEPGSSSNQSMNTTVSKSPSVLNTVNKEIKVNTFQSETVIEEITTTVTKTIRRVNQVNQQVFNSHQISAPRMAHQKNGPRMGNYNQIPKNYQGITVRHASPSIAGPRIRQAAPIRPALGPSVRPSNQLVPIRRNATIVRPNNSPRMQVKNMPRQLRPMTPLKISPNVMNPSLKRQSSEEASGPFSCFKKPKESLFPGNDTALEGGSDFNYASSSQTSKFCSSTKIVKDNTVVTNKQTKSQFISQQQQMSKQANASGLKIAKAKQEVQIERSEISASKRTTLEAIEKLQKQGLLVKKPRVEEDFSSPNFCGDDSDEYQGGE